MTTTTHNKQTKDILDWLEFLIGTYLEDEDEEFFRDVKNLYRATTGLFYPGDFAKKFCAKYRTETEAWEFPRNIRGVDWTALGEYIKSKVIDR